MRYGPMVHQTGGMGVIGSVLHIVFIVLFILLLLALLRRLIYGDRMWQRQWGRMPFPPQNSAIEILKERYAKGEINKQEFEEKKKDLEK